MEMYGKLHAACRKVVDIMATGKEVPWDLLQGSLLRQMSWSFLRMSFPVQCLVLGILC